MSVHRKQIFVECMDGIKLSYFIQKPFVEIFNNGYGYIYINVPRVRIWGLMIMLLLLLVRQVYSMIRNWVLKKPFSSSYWIVNIKIFSEIVITNKNMMLNGRRSRETVFLWASRKVQYMLLLGNGPCQLFLNEGQENQQKPMGLWGEGFSFRTPTFILFLPL